MISPSFVLKRLTNTNYKNWILTAKRLGKELNMSPLAVFADMIHCTIKHGAGYVDYDTLGMYAMSEAERKNVNTIGRNNQLVKELNQRDKVYIFDDKPSFNRVFADYVKRDWVLLNGSNYPEFSKFCEGREAFVAKPVDLSCGAGVHKVELSEEKDLGALYRRLINEGSVLLEEIVVQDDKMATLCTTSVNTIRIFTIRTDEEVVLINAVVRMGKEGNFVDNLNYGGYGARKGGLAAVINMENGELIMPAFDKNREHYDKVPILGTELKGFVIPRWDEVVEFVKEAAMVVPEVRFVGWDVVVTKDRGLLLIEGNDFPGNDLQSPKLGCGTYDVIMKALGRETW